MAKNEIIEGMYFDKAGAYLTGLQRSLEQAGGLYSLWSERTARMNSIEQAKLGNELGITAEGEYAPMASVNFVRPYATKVAEDKGPSMIKDKGAKLLTQTYEFEQQINNVWTDYAYHIVKEEGFGAVPPSAEELKENFVAGNYDQTLISHQQLLRNPETDLLLAQHNLQVEISSAHLDMGK